MNSFSRFRDKNQKRTVANQDVNKQFVFNAYNTIVLTEVNDTNAVANTVTASVVNLQEKDLAYIYTELSNPLDLGSVWSAKNLNWLIAEEIVIIKDVKWHKYLSYLCNVEIDNQWGFFKGPEKTYINVQLKEDAVLQSQQHPILIMPGSTYNIGDKLMINNRAWLIQEMDNISTEGVTYYSLRPSTFSKSVSEYKAEDQTETADIINEPETYSTSEPNYVPANIVITLPTTNAAFKTSNNAVKVISLSATSVSFRIPFGVKTVDITTNETYRFEVK